MPERGTCERTPSEEMFLISLYRLGGGDWPVKGLDVARRLGVSPAAVTQMGARLVAKGLVFKDSSGLKLTAAGRAEALRVLRKHRLAERLLTDLLGLGWADSHDEACRMEHAISEEAATAIEEVLGFPETCPHGQPIPRRDGSLSLTRGRALTELGRGERATILRVEAEEGDVLRELARMGLFPGTEVELEGSAPFRGPLLVKVGTARYAVDRGIARKLTVLPQLERDGEEKGGGS